MEIYNFDSNSPRWSDSFHDFHTVSNEKEKIAKAFQDHVSEKLFTFQHVHWLDIGCGDCAQLAEMSRFAPRVESYVLYDPDWQELRDQSKHNLQLLRSQDSHVKIHPDRFEDVVPPIINGDLCVSIVHSLFGKDKRSCFSALKKYLISTAYNYIIFVVAESEASFIHKAREELRSINLECPEPVNDEDIKYFFADDFKVQHKVIGSQKMLISDCRSNPDADTHWIFPFITGEAMVEYLRRPADERETIQSSVLKTLEHESNSQMVSIDDNLWVIEALPNFR